MLKLHKYNLPHFELVFSKGRIGTIEYLIVIPWMPGAGGSMASVGDLLERIFFISRVKEWQQGVILPIVDDPFGYVRL